MEFKMFFYIAFISISFLIYLVIALGNQREKLLYGIGNSFVFSKHHFFVELHSVISKKHNFIMQINSSDLESLIPGLYTRGGVQIDKYFDEDIKYFIVFNDKLAMQCLVKLEGYGFKAVKKQECLSNVLNIPCFNFQESDKYDFKEVVSFLDSVNLITVT